jgi:xanthine dehydrogenase accessory factor
VKEIDDLIAAFDDWGGEPLALATLVRAEGSSYRRPGARMLIGPEGKTTGILSAGCLEEEVAEHGPQVIARGKPVLLHFDTRRRFGCHGAIDILVETLQPGLIKQIRAARNARRCCTLETVFANSNSLGTRALSIEIAARTGSFVQTIHPRWRLLLVGRGPENAALKNFALILAWEVIEIESADFLPNELDEWTAVVVKTHHYGRDYAALARLLPMELPYLALLGPRRRRDQMLHVLHEEGVSLRSEFFAPAGLDLGSESPEEIALAIVAEILAAFSRASGQPLRNRKLPIHHSLDLAAV